MILSQAGQALDQGQVVGVPTDTVYGLGADPASPEAIQQLFVLKGRSYQLPLVVLTASATQAAQLVHIPVRVRSRLEHFWPGPLTAVFPAQVRFAERVGDHDRQTLAVRVPDQPLLIDLLTAWGPLAVTSANRSGQPPVTDHQAAQEIFGDRVAVYLPGECPGGVASTVVDLTGPSPRLLRPGPVEFA